MPRATAYASLCCLALGCSGIDSITASLGGDDGVTLTCGLDDRYLSTGAGKDGIASIDDPRWVTPADSAELTYLDGSDPVVGFVVDGRSYAVPLAVLRQHEIVNATFATGTGDLNLAITHCPLTGTSMIFDRAAIDGAELGVSGILYQSNLVMYDRSAEESLWPQMLGQASCGPAEGTELALYRSIEVSWDGWVSANPTTRVLGVPDGGSAASYASNPYAGYDDPNSRYTFPMPPLDERLAPKAAVLGVSVPNGPDWAFPLSELDGRGAFVALRQSLGPGADEAIVLWDRASGAAAVFDRRLDGATLAFGADAEGFFDGETGSRWTVDGLAVAGPLAGSRLEPVQASYVAYWGAWAAFFPFTRVWGLSGGIAG